jgi:hypothetical protein
MKMACEGVGGPSRILLVTFFLAPGIVQASPLRSTDSAHNRKPIVPYASATKQSETNCRNDET